MSDEAWIDTVRLARDMGDVSQLLPAGIATVRDIPKHLLDAIRSAMFYLSFENLEDEDRPPHEIWNSNVKLRGWFKEIKERHERKARGVEDIDDPVQNSAADMLIVD